MVHNILQLYIKIFILDIFNNIPFKIWIPHQVYIEFENNKEDIRKQQYNKYKDIPTNLQKHLNNVKNSIYSELHNYEKLDFEGIAPLKSEITKKFEEVSLIIKDYVSTQNINDELSREILRQDVAGSFIGDLKSRNCIGDPLTTQEQINIVEEGELRYKYHIPPGYMDDPQNNKKSKKSGLDIYGDLFLWKQIIKHASDCNVDIVLISNENKPDWYTENQPCKELIKEFNEETGQRIKVQKLNNFIGDVIEKYHLEKDNSYNLLLSIRAQELFEIKENEWTELIDNQIEVILSEYDYKQFRMPCEIIDIGFFDIDAIDYYNATVHYNSETNIAKYSYEFIVKILGSGKNNDYMMMPITFSEILHIDVTFDRTIGYSENNTIDLTNKNLEMDNFLVNIISPTFIDMNFDDSCIHDEFY